MDLAFLTTSKWFSRKYLSISSSLLLHLRFFFSWQVPECRPGDKSFMERLSTRREARRRAHVQRASIFAARWRTWAELVYGWVQARPDGYFWIQGLLQECRWVAFAVYQGGSAFFSVQRCVTHIRSWPHLFQPLIHVSLNTCQIGTGWNLFRRFTLHGSWRWRGLETFPLCGLLKTCS